MLKGYPVVSCNPFQEECNLGMWSRPANAQYPGREYERVDVFEI